MAFSSPAVSSFGELVAAQRRFFNTGATLPRAARRHALAALQAEIRGREPRIFAALRADLGKGAAEALMTETGLVRAEISHALGSLKAWMRPRRVGTPPALWPARSRVHFEPLGVALILSPWNYPFQLSLLPLVAAVGAGNCVVLKPSEKAPATADVLRGIVEAVFPVEHAAVVVGNVVAATELLRERFDFIFYTGSGRVGRTVMKAAAEHLTPVCLELGGKSPAIVAADADPELAARRIAWGKLLNAGQTCVAPDYVWADRRLGRPLMTALAEAFRRMLGDDPVHNPEYARMVDADAFDRLRGLAGDRLPDHAADAKNLRLAPCVLECDPADPLMAEEIFGPLLPVLLYDDVDEALRHVRERDKPLGLYLFTNDRELQRKVVETVSFGGGCVNDVVLQAASCRLPFGGVGASGMGRYHGRAGFELFSNAKGIVRQSARWDVPLRYPPFSALAVRVMRFLLR